MPIAQRLSAPVLDGLLVAGYFWLLPRIAAAFTDPSLWLALPVAAGYFALCAGVWLLKQIKRQAGTGKSDAKDDGWIGCLMPVLYFTFAVFSMGMMMHCLSAGQDAAGKAAIQNLPEAHPALFGLVCLLMLVWAGLFPGLAMSRPRPRFEPGSPAALAVRASAVLAANFMVLLSGGWLQSTLRSDGPTDLGPAGRALLFVLLYIVFLMFYAPPRLMLIRLDGDRLSLASFMVALAVLVWPLTA